VLNSDGSDIDDSDSEENVENNHVSNNDSIIEFNDTDDNCNDEYKSDNNCHIDSAPVFQPLPRKNKLLDHEELLHAVTGNSQTFRDIPNGTKESVYITLDNEDNIKQTLSGHMANYTDDCSVWDSKKGHTVKTKFVVTDDGKLKYVVEKHIHYIGTPTITRQSGDTS